MVLSSSTLLGVWCVHNFVSCTGNNLNCLFEKSSGSSKNTFRYFLYSSQYELKLLEFVLWWQKFAAKHLAWLSCCRFLNQPNYLKEEIRSFSFNGRGIVPAQARSCEVYIFTRGPLFSRAWRVSAWSYSDGLWRWWHPLGLIGNRENTGEYKVIPT